MTKGALPGFHWRQWLRSHRSLAEVTKAHGGYPDDMSRVVADAYESAALGRLGEVEAAFDQISSWFEQRRRQAEQARLAAERRRDLGRLQRR